MKKVSFKVAALLMAGTLVCSSCIGSFALFNKYEKWQCNMTSSKIVNGVVGLILQPIVGGVCLVVDALVLNTIEFWSGNNPMAQSTREIVGSDGRLYVITTTKNGYDVKDADGQVTRFTHDAATDAWSVEQKGVSRQLVRFAEDGRLQATLPSGATLTIAQDEAGVQQLREAVWTDGCYALR